MTTEAGRFCECGAHVELHRGHHQDGWWWRILDLEDLPPKLPPSEYLIDEVQRERAAAAAFTDTVTCWCGRTYQAEFDPPRVVGDTEEH